MRETVHSDKAPKAIGPYSQAIKAGGFLFSSGQIPMDPESGEMIQGGVKEQATQVFTNLRAVLEAAGCGFKDVVKTTVLLASMDDFGALNEVYAEFLGEFKPARSTFAAAGLPKNAKVEIELVAKLP